MDTRHVAFVRVGDHELPPVRADEPILALDHATSLGAWIRLGMDHIYDGRDHVAFVLALLLVVMLYPGARGEWHTRALVPTLRSTAGVVTAFTLAHSVSLIAAALGWVHLPSRLVESLIALSIAYTAGENIVKPDVRWRFALTFGFGLVHGLGFASTLAELLPPSHVIPPLLCFNVGIELGQLSIVLVALPILLALARWVGARRYRRQVMPALSSVILALGLAWLAGRALGIAILPWDSVLGR